MPSNVRANLLDDGVVVDTLVSVGNAGIAVCPGPFEVAAIVHRCPLNQPSSKPSQLAAPRRARESAASSPRATMLTCSSLNCPNTEDGWSYSKTACPASSSYSTTRIGAYCAAPSRCLVMSEAVMAL